VHAPDDAAEQIAALLDGIVRRQRRASREGLGESVTHGQFRVLRTLDRAERRATLVTLTPAGTQILTTLRENRREAMATVITRLTPTEQTTLINLLQRLAED
jgi:hypothetical protein